MHPMQKSDLASCKPARHVLFAWRAWAAKILLNCKAKIIFLVSFTTPRANKYHSIYPQKK